MSSEPKAPVPVFPLPGVVLFPRALLPLHVYELRYRTMVRDALSLERLIVLATLVPGWELDYQGSPAFHPIGCLARFEQVEWLPNDCYNLQVLGVTRVRIGRPVKEFPYRACRVTRLDDEPWTADDPLVLSEKQATLDVWNRLMATRASASPGGVPPSLEAEDVGFDVLVNALCMALPVPIERKIELLAIDSVLERGRRARSLIARSGPSPRRGRGESN